MGLPMVSSPIRSLVPLRPSFLDACPPCHEIGAFVLLLMLSLCSPASARAQSFVKSSGVNRQFPSGFLWGTATAAHQVEGGNTLNDWFDWEQIPGKIRNGERSGNAADHWNLYSEDLDRAQALGCSVYRFSIEWSRIEIEPGIFDGDAIDHYRKVILACRARHMEPMVTLFHFTLPRWFAASGGFETKGSVALFEKFAVRMGKEYGDIVDLWNTQNEPMVWLLAAYGSDVFPPGKASPLKMAQVLTHLISAHAKGYRALHAHDRTDANGDGHACQVGIAKHMRVFQPHREQHPGDRSMTQIADTAMNWMYLDAVTRGNAWFRWPGVDGFPLPGRELLGTLDFIGLNYYSRDLVHFNPTAPGFFERRVARGAPTTDLGWEIYPEGMYDILVRLKDYNLPIYITENGLADDAGTQRVSFIHDHLDAVLRAIDDGVDVRGYIHWSLMDNFEWAEGFSPRFGLYKVDYSTQERSLTEGGAYFKAIATSNSLLPPGEKAEHAR